MINPFLISLKSFQDDRGTFYESYKDILLSKYKIHFEIKQENTCISNKNVIRGFHYQTGDYSQAKLLSVLNGKIKDVLIDIRPGETYGKIWVFELSSEIKQILYIPHGFAHGYGIYENNTIVSYKTDCIYNKDCESGFNPLSISLLEKINWNIQKPIISNKDLNLQLFE